MATSNSLMKLIFGNMLDQEMTLLDALLILEKNGLLNQGELAEKAISKATKVDQCRKNQPKIDLVNGVQIKTGTTNYTGKGHLKYAYVNIGRNGVTHGRTLYCVIRDIPTQKEYYFILPWSAYWHKSGNTIGIPFERDGGPYQSSKWWEYEVPWNHFREAIKEHEDA